ncbi:uncharacterized protein si:dkey-171c9.3 [Megalops cyprinoides]|uniref:uncharacterized protein si:dkey-171c9.3 n=1 Tax=Megalops cyprinoides TaxID=118141 RepID=UPI001863CA37|nr:uncharacterized protein si:dkey-171c9.3 [Megalops cyprinoides]
MADRMALDWMSSRLRLCDLSTGTVSQPEQDKALREAIFDCQSCPPPAYCRSSVLSSLKTYTCILKRVEGEHSEGRVVQSDQYPPEFSATAGAARDSVYRFAHSLAEDILQSARGQWEMVMARSPRGPLGNPETLSSDIVQSALKEAAREGDPQSPWCPRRRSKSAPDPRGRVLQSVGEEFAEQGSGGGEAEVLPGACPWFCSGLPPGGQSCCSILAHSGLPSRGSLDYPDAPPTTPLLPEMIKSRASFQRRLKGGLAKEFMPSPPPPTPKDQPSHSPTGGPVAGDDREEFVARLMRSLSLECSEGGELEMEERAQNSGSGPEGTPAGLLDYAAQLSAEIICSVTAECEARSGGQVKAGTPPERLLHAVERWTEEVIEESLLEIMAKEARQRAADGRPAKARHTAAMQRPSCSEVSPDEGLERRLKDVVSVSGLDDESMLWDGSQTSTASRGEALNAFAGRLVSDTLRWALRELGRPALHCHPDPVREMAEELCQGIVAQAVHAAALQHGARQPPGSPAERCSPGSRKPGAGGALSHSIDPSYVEALAEAVVRDSVREAMRRQLRMCKGSGWMRSEVRAVLDTQAHSGIQALQGALLWAAASSVGTSALQLALPDTRLQTQFSTVAQRAQLIGWTVGDLMTSVLQYCELAEQLASRGHSPDIPLLKCLQEQLEGNEAMEQ